MSAYLHTDMGSEYTSSVFENLLATNHIRHSYSKKDHPVMQKSVQLIDIRADNFEHEFAMVPLYQHYSAHLKT